MRLEEEFPTEIRGKAFRLRPDIPPGGAARPLRPGENNDGILGGHLGASAAEAGLVMRRPPRTAYTVPALEATEFASQQGLFQPFHHALYRAYWEHGQDIEQVSVLQEAAREAGLDPDALARSLEEGRYRATVEEQFQEALTLGIHSIPSFVVGGVLFSGAHPYELFRSVARRALEGGALTR